MIKKKFAELELSLLHLQQNVEIPEAHPPNPPHNTTRSLQALATNTRPSLSYIPPKLLNDSTFLNTLHAHVNSWIKSIQAVTKLNRDVASGTTSQEINFWLSSERAWEEIEAQLRSEEVGTLVMDCLRNAKRFHTTIGFIAGTGLKDATGNGTLRPSSPILLRLFDAEWIVCSAQVQPTNEGLPPQRTPLRNRRRQNPRILLLIFGHINRKFKLSSYPIRRASSP